MNTGDSLISVLSALPAQFCPVEPISAFYGQDGQEAFFVPDADLQQKSA
jgi:hypothetical protein